MKMWVWISTHQSTSRSGKDGRRRHGKNSDPRTRVTHRPDLHARTTFPPSNRAWGMLSEHSLAESHLSLLFTFRERVLLSCPSYLELIILLFYPPECWFISCHQPLKELLSIKPHNTKRTFLYNERVLAKEEGVSLYPSWYPQYHERLTEESKYDEGCKRGSHFRIT